MDLTKSMKLVSTVIRNTIRDAVLVIHKKTGNMYILLNDELIECTNGREDKKYCLYVNLEGMVFVREQDEFYQKFEKWEVSNGLLDKS